MAQAPSGERQDIAAGQHFLPLALKEGLQSVKKTPGMALAGFDMNMTNLRRDRQKVVNHRNWESEESR
jgi:hypothetical protein